MILNLILLKKTDFEYNFNDKKLILNVILMTKADFEGDFDEKK